jgi:hypothetical protein
MPFNGTQNLNFNKVSPMSPDQTVTHVPGLDLNRAATTGSGHSGAGWHPAAGFQPAVFITPRAPATVVGEHRYRRRIRKTTTPNPIPNIAQVPGSGAAKAASVLAIKPAYCATFSSPAPSPKLQFGVPPEAEIKS